MIKLRHPTVEMEYETITKKNFEIIKVFPSFTTFVKPEDIIRPKAEQARQNDIRVEEVKQDKVKPKLADFDPNEFCPEEIEDPDYIENLKSLKVIEMKIKETQAQVDKIEGRAPPKLREKLIKLRVKYKAIESNINEGVLGPEKYITILKLQLDHDRKLLSYLESLKQMGKAKQVSERIPILIREIDDMIKYLKSK